MSIYKKKLILLEFVFIVVFVGVYMWKGGISIPPGMTLFMMCLGTMRLAQTLSFNEIAEPLRSRFTFVKPDSCGAGDNVEPKPGSSIGSLLACPICTGTWVALGFMVAYQLDPKLTTLFAYITGIAGASETLHYLTEVLSWWGRAGRVISGSISPDKD